jgi:hypothetical protein
MKTHAEVHLEIRRILVGTRLKSFQVTTNSWEHLDGTVAVEWVCCVVGGTGEPIFYYSARDPGVLVIRVAAGLDKRRAEFAAHPGVLEQLHGPAPMVST